MILQELARYYERLASQGDGDVAAEGFEKKEIPFLVVLDREGRLIDIQDTRETQGKKRPGRVFTVPRGVKRAVNIAANILWDTPAYIFGRPKPDPKKDSQSLLERAKKQQLSFMKELERCFPAPEVDEGILSVVRFLQGGVFDGLFSHPLWADIEQRGAFLSFKLDDDLCLVCQRPKVVAMLRSLTVQPEAAVGLQPCLVSGRDDTPRRLHAAIKGVWGAQSSGANIVSFNLDAFCSYGKEQGLNAPVGERAEFAYVTALNTLLGKGSHQRLQVADASTVFWAEHRHPLEDLFADLFGEPAKENPEQLNVAIHALFEAPVIGSPPLDQDTTRFFVLGLAPNAGRIAVRFWYPGTVADIVRHIRQHFDDCAISHGPKQPEYLSLFRLLVSTASLGKAENIQPNLAGHFMKALLAGTPYPQTLLASAVRRCRAEREVTHPRAALIKAVLARSARYYRSNEKEVGMSLDLSNENIGYRLGRLFAVLEKIQEEASPGINATIRDRFYGSASSTPVAAFPHLMKLKNHHLAKLENRGRAVNLERLIGEIMDGIADFPTHLNLQDQGRFAVGYYHQRQDFFTKKDNQ